MGASVDHDIQLSQGGTNALANLRAAHRWCNQAASDKTPGTPPPLRSNWRERDNVDEVPPWPQWAAERLPPLTRNMRPDVYDRLRQAERDARDSAGLVP